MNVDNKHSHRYNTSQYKVLITYSYYYPLYLVYSDMYEKSCARWPVSQLTTAATRIRRPYLLLSIPFLPWPYPYQKTPPP
jgi:hypothetical protein